MKSVKLCRLHLCKMVLLISLMGWSVGNRLFNYIKLSFSLTSVLLLSVTAANASTPDIRVNSISARLGAASVFACENFELSGEVTPCAGDISIVESSSFNAWSRDGKIALTSRLVDLTSDDELAYVIAHEMAHLILNHPGSTARRELEADRWAAKIMHRAGFDAISAESVLARGQFRRVLGFPFSLITHPANSQRMKTIKHALAEEVALKTEHSGLRTESATINLLSVLP